LEEKMLKAAYYEEIAKRPAKRKVIKPRRSSKGLLSVLPKRKLKKVLRKALTKALRWTNRI
jgi:hypothetical protein